VKQVVQSWKDGAIEIVDVPVPVVEPGFVLVRVAASVVSAGTERAAIEFGRQNLLGKARARPHLVRQVLEKVTRDGVIATVQAVSSRLDGVNVLGYSCAGSVVQVGAGVTDLMPGDRVACAGAGHASHSEYVSVPRNLTANVPAGDATLLEDAAFATLGSIALHGVRLGDARLGETVALIGLGLVGHLALQLLKAAGCTVVGTDPDPRRVELARQCGIDAACSDRSEFVAACLQRSTGRGVDVTLITAATPGNEPIELAGDITREKGKVVAVGDVGLGVPRRTFYGKEIELIVSRSYGPGRYDQEYEERGHDYPYGYVRWTEQRNMQAFVDLLARRVVKVQPLITHRYAIEDAAAAYELIAGKTSEPYLGVVIRYAQSAPPTRRVELRPADPGLPAPRTGRIGLGVVGAGGFVNSVLVPAFKKTGGVDLVMVANRSGVTARAAARRFGFRSFASDPGEVFASPEVDLVVIGTPHHLHAGQTAAALKAGKHVFVEKPLGLTRADLALVADALKASPGRRLMVGFNRRFAPLALEAAAALRSRQEPLVVHYRVNAGYIPLDHWIQDRAIGGGRLLGEGCHFLDFMIWLTGARVKEVMAWGMDDAGRYREDNFVVQLRFVDGSLGTLTYVANGSRRTGKERVEAYCQEHTIVLDDFRRLEIARPGRLRSEKSRMWRSDKGHAQECRLTIDGLLRGSEPALPVADALYSTLVTLTAHESLRRREPMPIAADDFGRAAEAIGSRRVPAR
jgi:predicted dehydrogenase/threonine dehydrogenase-like Zn-dependent dehydrogenase